MLVITKRLRSWLQSHERGFTLVELLVVIAIMAILVAVVVPNFTGLIGRGDLVSYNSEKKTVQEIVDSYLADNRISAFTAAWTIVDAAVPSGAKAPGTTLAETYFRQQTKWCWKVATDGKITNSVLVADGCTVAAPALPAGGAA